MLCLELSFSLAFLVLDLSNLMIILVSDQILEFENESEIKHLEILKTLLMYVWLLFLMIVPTVLRFMLHHSDVLIPIRDIW